MNFNFQNQPAYDLNTSLTEEMISLYGVMVKLLIVEKINKDDLVFGDYSHIKTNWQDVYEMFMLPENSDDWEQAEYDFTQFGLMNFDNIKLFVPRSSVDGIFSNNDRELTGNLLVFPNNKIMEITNTDLTTPGINNLFTYDNAKSVYTLSCKPYATKLTDELNTEDISYDGSEYEQLDKYFDDLMDTKLEQDKNALEVTHVETIEENEIVKKPIVDKTEDDVFGSF